MSRPQLQSRPSSRLSVNKTIVLVTGGNAGIGYEIVKALATTQPNFQILLGCRDTSKGETAAANMGAPANVNPIQLDITDDASIEHCYKTIEQVFGKLDILINNAGTAGLDVSKKGVPQGSREMWSHVYNVNCVSTGVLTEAMIPLLEKSQLPKIIFISSSLGSIDRLSKNGILYRGPWYNSSKSAVNHLTAYYAKAYPNFKVNACCPGYRATGLNDEVLNEKTDPALGAVNAMRLAVAGSDSGTGTYSNTEGSIPW